MARHLIPTTDVAKAVRALLKKAYPGEKFSVTCSRGSSYVNVRWSDGPTDDSVRATVALDTVRECFASPDGDTVVLVCDGILTSRKIGPDGMADVADRINRIEPGAVVIDPSAPHRPANGGDRLAESTFDRLGLRHDFAAQCVVDLAVHQVHARTDYTRQAVA